MLLQPVSFIAAPVSTDPLHLHVSPTIFYLNTCRAVIVLPVLKSQLAAECIRIKALRALTIISQPAVRKRAAASISKGNF